MSLLRSFSWPLVASFSIFFLAGAVQAALLPGPFQTCQRSPLTLRVDVTVITLSDGTSYTAPVALQPTGDFLFDMVPGRILRAIERDTDLSCPGGSRIWLYRVPAVSGAPLEPIITGMCLPSGLAAECYYSGSAAGSPQLTAAFTQFQTPASPEQRITWVDMGSGLSGTSILTHQIEPGSLRFGASGTTALVQHDLLAGPGLSDWAVFDLCPGNVGTRLTNQVTPRLRAEHSIAYFETEESEFLNLSGSAVLYQVDPGTENPDSGEGQFP
ncbi:MAG: hypothetical protein MI919_40420, partial [Holophagales bacterium]|nr:hypothetical protein [Holophagales bacterium]